jgi:phosphatidylglycerophosphate synthase
MRGKTGKAHDLKATFKSLDTEEFIDVRFYRPAGYWWAKLFRKLGVSPNAVTLAAMFLGTGAGVCFYFTDPAVNVAGMLLLIWANMYDSADGQLARMTGRTSAFGRMLDGFCGDVWFVTIYAAICLRLTPQWGAWAWALGAAAGYCHSRQAALADYYRNAHLFFLLGKAGSELSHAAALREAYGRLSWKNDFLLKTGYALYLRYTKGQEKQTPQLQRMLGLVRGQYGEEAPEWLRRSFRAESLPLMKYANMLSFNTRVLALFVSLLIRTPWLYFVFEATALNAMFVYMLVKHERFCATFARELES